MNNSSEDDFKFIDLSEFLKGSLLLEPYKETIGHFYGEQLLIAVDLWQQDRIDEALPIFDDVYDVFPTFFVHKFIRISRCIKDLDAEELLAELAELPYENYTENLDKFLFHLAKAFAQFKMFDMDDCTDSCKKAIEFIVDFTPIYLLLADSLIIRYKYFESIKYYKVVLKFGDYKKDSATANMAYAYLNLKKNRKARKLFKKIVDRFPDNYKIQYNMALCYLRTRKYGEAHKYLDRVEKINAEFTGLHLTRGGLFLKQQNHNKAIESLRLAKGLGSEQASNILEQIG